MGEYIQTFLEEVVLYLNRLQEIRVINKDTQKDIQAHIDTRMHRC